MMKRLLFLLLVPAILFSCAPQEKDPAAWVDPFTGTQDNGNTFFGASRPFGMVKLGPWVQYDTTGTGGTLRGFSHTHVSGMAGGGNTASGEVIFMPFTGTAAANKGFACRYLHDGEEASPQSYSVVDAHHRFRVTLAAAPRSGILKIDYLSGDTTGVALLVRGGSITLSQDHLTGTDRGVSFYSRFSRPLMSWQVRAGGHPLPQSRHCEGEELQVLLFFRPSEKGSLFIETGISYVDTTGARGNLLADAGTGQGEVLFRRYVEEGRRAWNRELSRIEIEGGTREQRILFYTSLYHAFMHPNLFMDADRRYRSTNGKIYRATGFDNYTNFSLWDTFRALHPLFTLLQRQRTVQFIRTFLARYDHTGRMLIMEFNGVEGTQPPMIAYHSLSVLADAFVKGIRGYDTVKAYRAMQQLADDLHRKGKQLYLDYGFIPSDMKGQSVSRTLEYSYDDWCVTRLATAFGDTAALVKYGRRGDFYRNLFDTTTRFMRGRKRNFEFVTPFDPEVTVNHYTEANAYQYSTFVPQDLYGLIRLMGGDSAFTTWLDTCFDKKTDPSKINVRDVSGLIGQYAHGNEPSHHMAYLWDYAGAPWKTQRMVRRIMNSLYHNTPGGIAGNEDCGQMSAWYVMSALGLYAVTPGLPYYALGSPLFRKATIHLENGKDFVIRAPGNGAGRPYIRSATLNGEPWQRCYLRQEDILAGGELVLEMSDRPDTSWATAPEARPPAPERPFRWAYPATPHFEDIYFADPLPVTLTSADPRDKVFYTLDGRAPGPGSSVYRQPFVIDRPRILRTRSYRAGVWPSFVRTVHFIKISTLPAVAPRRSLRPGIVYHLIDQPVENAATVQDYPVTRTGVTSLFRLDLVKDQRPFGEWFEGYLKVPATGIYTLALEANDGAILYLNGREIVNNDGGHRSQKLDMKIKLEKGYHPILVKYFQQGLAKNLRVTWQGPGMPEQEIPEEALFH